MQTTIMVNGNKKVIQLTIPLTRSGYTRGERDVLIELDKAQATALNEMLTHLIGGMHEG